MKQLKSLLIKARSYPRLLIFCWILIPVLTIDVFYIGKMVPSRIRRTFLGLESQWHDFLVRHQSSEIIDQNRTLDKEIQDEIYEVNSSSFQRNFDLLSVKTKTPKDTAIVAIDEKTLTELGEWPIRRHHYARLLDRILSEAGARGVVFDIMFSEQGDRLPIEKLEAIGRQGDPQLKALTAQAIREIDYDSFLEATMKEHRLKIVAGYTTLQDEESKVKDYSNTYFPQPLRKYPGEDRELTLSIPKVNGGVYNYPGILDSILFRGFFSVPTDPLDGLVRKVHLLTRYPMKFRDLLGETSEEKVELFGSIDLEAYAMLDGALNPPIKEGSYLVMKSHSQKRLNQATREEISRMVREAVSRVADLSTFQRSLLIQIIEKTEFFGNEIYRGLSLLIAQYVLGMLTWSENPDEGFLLNLIVKETELKEAILLDLDEETRAEILGTSDAAQLKEFLNDLKMVHSQLGARLIYLFTEQVLAPLSQEMILLHSFSEMERGRILQEITTHLGINEALLKKLFQAENLVDHQPQVRMQANSEVGINYYGVANSFPVYSFVDVLKKDRLMPRYLGYDLPEVTLEEALKNRIIYIGPTAAGINDWRNTPIYKQLDGVELHAHALANLRDGTQILRGPDNRVFEFLLMVVLGVFLPLLLISVNAVLGAVLVIGFIASYSFYCMNAFSVTQNYFYFIPPFLQCLVTYILQTSYSYVKEQAERRKTRNAFQHYVNASVVDAVLRDPDMLKLGGQRRELSVLFSDVRSFTTISEGLDPETLVALMNEYLTDMTDLVLHYNGTLDKFIGDAVMAFWGAPIGQEDHAYRAVMTAIEMNKRVNEMFDDFKSRYGVEIRIGIGVNTGPAVVGNMGSRSRFDYTILGDTVNLGARLEGQTKSYGAELIIAETTYHDVKDWAATRFLDLIAVKGKTEPVRIYECPGVAKEMDERFLEGLKKFEEAVDVYYMGRRFEEGISVFESLKNYRGGNDVACDLYISRCKEFHKNPPPEEWDGVFVATSK